MPYMYSYSIFITYISIIVTNCTLGTVSGLSRTPPGSSLSLGHRRDSLVAASWQPRDWLRAARDILFVRRISSTENARVILSALYVYLYHRSDLYPRSDLYYCGDEICKLNTNTISRNRFLLLVIIIKYVIWF